MTRTYNQLLRRMEGVRRRHPLINQYLLLVCLFIQLIAVLFIFGPEST